MPRDLRGTSDESNLIARFLRDADVFLRLGALNHEPRRRSYAYHSLSQASSLHALS
jgi:hypothetical protein